MLKGLWFCPTQKAITPFLEMIAFFSELIFLTTSVMAQARYSYSCKERDSPNRTIDLETRNRELEKQNRHLIDILTQARAEIDGLKEDIKNRN